MGTPSRKRTQRLIEKEDRLSSLPDELLHKILALLDDTKFAAQTTVLSKRWTRLWVSLDDLCFHTGYFDDDSNFEKFVLRFLQQRDWGSELPRLRLFTVGFNRENTQCLIEYAVRHRLRHLMVNSDVEFHTQDTLALFQCQTLETLELDGFHFLDMSSPGPGLTSVTTLCLKGCDIKGCFDVMAAFPNLTTSCLTDLNIYKVDGDQHEETPDVLKICGYRLVSLTMIDVACSKAILSLPNLTCFKYQNMGWSSFRFPDTYLPSLQHAELYVGKRTCNSMNFCSRFFTLFHGLSNIQSLKLNSCPLQVLNTSGLLEHRTSPFSKLKSLTLDMHSPKDGKHCWILPANVMSYLLGGTPHSQNMQIKFQWESRDRSYSICNHQFLG